jgi:NDP-sugar pyrophosphorylase family protein
MPEARDAVVLCGGAGLRLRSVVGDAPKGMAAIQGRPFLEVLLRQLRRHGFRRAILAVGYQREAIQNHFGEAAFDLEIAYAVEQSPLGTAGGLRNAAGLIRSDSVLVMNGDSYTDVDLARLMAEYDRGEADGLLVAVASDGRGDCGSVLLDKEGNLVGFAEKRGPSYTPYVNAGIYVVSREMLDEIPPALAVSLEHDTLPAWLNQGRRIKAFFCSSPCVDIGTPDRFASAQQLLAKVESGADDPARERRV